MTIYTIGDTRPDLDFNLRRDGEPYPNVAAVQFRLQKTSGAVVTVDLVQVDAPTQRWSGDFNSGDLDETGPMLAEVVITQTDGGVRHLPEPLTITVRAEYVAVDV